MKKRYLLLTLLISFMFLSCEKHEENVVVGSSNGVILDSNGGEFNPFDDSESMSSDASSSSSSNPYYQDSNYKKVIGKYHSKQAETDYEFEIYGDNRATLKCDGYEKILEFKRDPNSNPHKENRLEKDGYFTFVCIGHEGSILEFWDKRNDDYTLELVKDEEDYILNTYEYTLYFLSNPGDELEKE